jgi:Flagellar biosynthesis protein, FliO
VNPLRLRPRGATLALAGLGALACGALALLPGEAGPVAARAGLLTLGLGVAALLVRRRAAEAPPPRLRVVARATLARDASAVLVELDGRPVLLGVGRDGVRLLAETGWMGPEVDP